MVCFHCQTPIPIPTPMKLGSMIMCRIVFTKPTPIPIVIPIPIPMATVPNLAPISVLIKWNLTNFHCNFCIGIGPSGAFGYFISIGVGIGIGIGVGQWKCTMTPIPIPIPILYRKATLGPIPMVTPLQCYYENHLKNRYWCQIGYSTHLHSFDLVRFRFHFRSV